MPVIFTFNGLAFAMFCKAEKTTGATMGAASLPKNCLRLSMRLTIYDAGMATHHVMLRRSRLAAHLPALQASVASDSLLAIPRHHTCPVRRPVFHRDYT